MKRERMAVVILFLFFAFGCAAGVSSAEYYTPRPDGKYDNNTFLVDSEKTHFDSAAKSIVTIITRAVFQDPNIGERVKEQEGSGVALFGRYILTVAHTVAIRLTTQTSVGVFELPNKKVSEERYFRAKGSKELIKLKVLYLDEESDVALLQLPEGVNLDSFPYPLGNSDDLRVGNFTYIIGNPLNAGINIREGIVSAISAIQGVSEIDVKGENAFMVSNGLIPGDSGTPIIAIRDGRLEIVGLAQGTMGISNLGWAIRINVIRELLLAAPEVPDDFK